MDSSDILLIVSCCNQGRSKSSPSASFTPVNSSDFSAEMAEWIEAAMNEIEEELEFEGEF